MMIGTCGHEVDTGLMLELRVDSETVSYGSYCSDCAWAHFQHGDLLSKEATEIFQKLTDIQRKYDVAVVALRGIQSHYGEDTYGGDVADEALQEIEVLGSTGKGERG